MGGCVLIGCAGPQQGGNTEDQGVTAWGSLEPSGRCSWKDLIRCVFALRDLWTDLAELPLLMFHLIFPLVLGRRSRRAWQHWGTRAAGCLPSDGDRRGRACALAAPFFMQKRAVFA